jgi:hypothetical protein
MVYAMHMFSLESGALENILFFVVDLKIFIQCVESGKNTRYRRRK